MCVEIKERHKLPMGLHHFLNSIGFDVCMVGGNCYVRHNKRSFRVSEEQLERVCDCLEQSAVEMLADMLAEHQQSEE